MLKIEKIVNNPVSSCCYIVYDSAIFQECIVIDPASEDITQLLTFISDNNLQPKYIILTHEHFDHCLSVNALREIFHHIKLICSMECNDAIGSEKKNCSVFWDNEKAFTISEADIITDTLDNKLDWNNHIINFIPTPGHTRGSISIMIDRFLFTGDALIPGLKTVTKLPGGDKAQAKESENKINGLIRDFNLEICPGH